jgi:hypothetical protein
MRLKVGKKKINSLILPVFSPVFFVVKRGEYSSMAFPFRLATLFILYNYKLNEYSFTYQRWFAAVKVKAAFVRKLWKELNII